MQNTDSTNNITGWKVSLIIATICGVVFLIGVLTDVSLGDENYHVGFARAMFDKGWRVSFNPVYPGGDPPGYYYATEIMWPAVLAQLWKVVGDHCIILAQAYQAGSLAILLSSVYLIGKRFAGSRAGLWSMLLTASIPMVVSFSIILYTDVPATALLMAALAACCYRRFFLTGLLVGLAFLTKKNTICLVPLIVILAAVHSKNRKQFILSMLMIGLGGLVVIMPKIFLYQRDISAGKGPTQGSDILKRLTQFWTDENLSSHMTNPIDLALYLGPLLGLGALFYLAANKFKKVDWPWWTGVGIGWIATVLVFTFNTDIRYLMPAVPLITLPLGRMLAESRQRRIKTIVIIVCCLQFIGVTGFLLFKERRLPKQTKQAYANLQKIIPEKAFVIHHKEAFGFYARRPIVWSHLVDPDTEEKIKVAGIFWPQPDTPERIHDILKHNRIKFILVSGTPYDDSDQKHLGEFPKSFVNRLPRLEFLEKVQGDWPGFELWKLTVQPSQFTPKTDAPPPVNSH